MKVKIFLICYSIFGTVMVFVMWQLHIAAGGLHIAAVDMYQHSLENRCPKHPEDEHCKDLGNYGITYYIAKWESKFGVF